jgi:hypothetical protein
MPVPRAGARRVDPAGRLAGLGHHGRAAAAPPRARAQRLTRPPVPPPPPAPRAKTQLCLPRFLVAQVVPAGPWLQWVPAEGQACGNGPETQLTWGELSRGFAAGTYILASRGAAAAPGRSRRPPSRFGMGCPNY